MVQIKLKDDVWDDVSDKIYDLIDHDLITHIVDQQANPISFIMEMKDFLLWVRVV